MPLPSKNDAEESGAFILATTLPSLESVRGISVDEKEGSSRAIGNLVTCTSS